MNKSDNKLHFVSLCAVLMMIVTFSVYFFESKYGTSSVSDSSLTTAYAIASLSSGPACVSVENAQVLWNCAESTCTDAEVSECLASAPTYQAFLADDDDIVVSETASQTQEVAGIADIACPATGGGYTGQRNCVSGQRVSVVGTPRVFNKGPNGVIVDAGPFVRSASKNVTDRARYFDVNVGEPVRIAINLKNNSANRVADQYNFFVNKVVEAPKGTQVDYKTPLCDAQLNELNGAKNTTQVKQYSKVGTQYFLEPGQTKLIGAEWIPTKTECGLYQIDLGADTFADVGAKQCPSTKSQNSVIAAAFVRVSGCDITPPPAQTCIYKPLPKNVEQYRVISDNGSYKEVNSPARLTTFTVPSGSEKRVVKVRYVYSPVRDKTNRAKPTKPNSIDAPQDATNVRCGPQSNEEAELQVVGENLLNRTYFGAHRFVDNKYLDVIEDPVTNPNPAKPIAVEQTLQLPPGAYSITSRWQGDGQNFWDQPLVGYKYYIDVRNPSKGMITYEEAVADSNKYGPACKWGGSYQIAATYCIVGENANPAAEMQKATITIKNSDLVKNTFSAQLFVNGVKLVQGNGRDQVAVKAGETKKFEFVYQNEFPQTSVLELVETDKSQATGLLVNATVTKVNSTQPYLATNSTQEITQTGVRLKFGQN